MAVHTIADVTTSGPLSATSKPCQWVLVRAGSGNTASARVGDSDTGASRGVELAKGDPPVSFPPINVPTRGIAGSVDLANIYVHLGSGDSVSVTYGD